MGGDTSCHSNTPPTSLSALWSGGHGVLIYYDPLRITISKLLSIVYCLSIAN